MNITDPIRTQARERPDAVASVRRRGQVTTYADLDRRIDALARRLTTLGVVPGDVAIVAMGAPNRAILMQLALARVGAAAATWTFPAARATFCLVPRGEPGPGHPRTVVVEREWYDDLPGAGAPVVPHVDPSLVAAIFPAVSEDGELRFVALTHAALAARIAVAERALATSASVRQLSLLSPQCAHGYLSMLRVQWAGGVNVFATTRPDELVSTARELEVNRLVAQPNALVALTAGLPPGARALPALEQVEISGGDAPSTLVALAHERLGGEFHSLYRTTECGPIAAAPFAALDRPAGDVGVVIPGVEVMAVDDAGSPLPPGVEGRLRVTGGGVAPSFVASSTRPGHASAGGSCVTEDRGTVTAAGTVRLAARAGEVINAGGNRAHPARLEEALAALPWIGDAAVFGVPDAQGIVQLAAAIVPTARAVPEDIAKLGFHHDTHSPTVLMQVREIPRDAAGVPRRDLLAEMAVAGRSTSKLH